MAEMGFLCRVTEVALCDRVRRSAILKRITVDLLLLHIERTQVRYWAPECDALWSSHFGGDHRMDGWMGRSMDGYFRLL